MIACERGRSDINNSGADIETLNFADYAANIKNIEREMLNKRKKVKESVWSALG